MNQALLQPVYFGDIAHFVALLGYDDVIWENCDHFQKQTLRNRMYVYGANGKLMLNIPVKHSGGLRKKTAEMCIENQFSWQDQHWKSLCSAYRSSPYFEFYEDDLRPLYTRKFIHLSDWNFACLEWIHRFLPLDFSTQKTTEFQLKPDASFTDYRFLAAFKKHQFDFEPYTQVFTVSGFLSNLSILDLLFNLGPQSLDYLKRQVL